VHPVSPCILLDPCLRRDEVIADKSSPGDRLFRYSDGLNPVNPCILLNPCLPGDDVIAKKRVRDLPPQPVLD
jgi:hypothetical protein